MFNKNEYDKFRSYLELEDSSLTDIAKETGTKHSMAVTYLSKYLSEKHRIKP